MGIVSWGGLGLVALYLFFFFFCLMHPFCASVTDSRDVAALNNLYVSLGYPPLRGWILVGGDPCEEGWQGVECIYSNISGLNLNGMKLGGQLGDTLDFPSILSIDLSNNQIGGNLPSNLPPTLTELSLSNNLFSGGIPDAFQPLASLIDLDLSGNNNLTGPLPPSFANLSSLTILRLQNNKLTGTLDVIQDLPLADLNIENNLFSGPIPPRLLTIPSFKKDGNPFNTSVIPSPPAAPPLEAPTSSPSPSSSVSVEPSPHYPAPWKRENGQSTDTTTQHGGGSRVASKMVIVIAGLIGVLTVLVIVGLFLCGRGKKRHELLLYQNPRGGGTMQPHNNRMMERGGVPKVVYGERLGAYPGAPTDNVEQRKLSSLPLQPSPPSLPIEKPPLNLGTSTLKRPPVERLNAIGSVTSYSIASLQQFTKSFSQQNFIGKGMLGTVYKGKLPNGKVIAIKKLESWRGNGGDDEFVQLVSGISKLQHQNIVELVGFCSEYGQRLLVYNFCKFGTLHDALHVDDEMHKTLTWNIRIRIALGAARALEYLHEICKPGLVHRNFKSGNILLDDDLNVRVSDCGFAPLLASECVRQSSDIFLAGNGYAAPELESGGYTWQSDVYSFGVVMLELLTGRLPYDSGRGRGSQYLARWAVYWLYDIDALSKMVDPSMNNNAVGGYNVKSLSRFADIISRCIQREPEFRPPMSEVVQDLLHMV